MAPLTPKTEILRALFARSGNQCAFPVCAQPLVNDKNKFIAQVCHIDQHQRVVNDLIQKATTNIGEATKTY